MTKVDDGDRILALELKDAARVLNECIWRALDAGLSVEVETVNVSTVSRPGEVLVEVAVERRYRL